MESQSLKDQSQLLPQWMIEMKDELECPVCLKTIMDPPVFLCEKGHCLCSTCREDIKNRGQPCPVCRGALTDVRNLTVEQMLDKLPKNKCKYNGCQFEKQNLDLVKMHEIECKYRLVNCGKCDTEIALVKLPEHLTSNHHNPPFTIILGEEQNYFLSRACFFDNHQPLECDGKYFYINQKEYNKNLVMFWISFSGSQGDANKYEYMLKIKSTEPQPDYLFTGARRSVSCEVSHKEMKEESTALFIDKQLLHLAAGRITNPYASNVKFRLMIKRR